MAFTPDDNSSCLTSLTIDKFKLKNYIKLKKKKKVSLHVRSACDETSQDRKSVG